MAIAYYKPPEANTPMDGRKRFSVRVKALVNTNAPTIAQKAAKAVLKDFRSIRCHDKKIVAM